MARYDFQCSKGHVTEYTFAMADVPASVICQHAVGKRTCLLGATRVFAVPTIQFHGRSSFTNSYTGRKRRPNPGDDLPRENDPFAEAMAR